MFCVYSETHVEPYNNSTGCRDEAINCNSKVNLPVYGQGGLVTSDPKQYLNINVPPVVLFFVPSSALWYQKWTTVKYCQWGGNLINLNLEIQICFIIFTLPLISIICIFFFLSLWWWIVCFFSLSSTLILSWYINAKTVKLNICNWLHLTISKWHCPMVKLISCLKGFWTEAIQLH